MRQLTNPQLLEDMLREGVERRVRALVDEAVQKACVDITLQINKEAASIAIDLSRHFSIETLTDRFVITVHKLEPPK